MGTKNNQREKENLGGRGRGEDTAMEALNGDVQKWSGTKIYSKEGELRRERETAGQRDSGGERWGQTREDAKKWRVERGEKGRICVTMWTGRKRASRRVREREN